MGGTRRQLCAGKQTYRHVPFFDRSEITRKHFGEPRRYEPVTHLRGPGRDEEAEAGAAKVFKSMDTDGTVDAKELGNRLDAAGLKAADTDNDGTLDEKEYMSLVDQKFKAADTGNEGTLGAKELDSPAGQELLKLIR